MKYVDSTNYIIISRFMYMNCVIKLKSELWNASKYRYKIIAGVNTMRFIHKMKQVV